ncbi:MAG TPA: DUF4126 family protein [Terriglobales bacterium]|nr:DUF4126 family protein [Terriglobales bacterium]
MGFGMVLCALGIGFVAGLRTNTAPAVVAIGAHLGWINLAGTRLAFMGTKWAVGIFVFAALGEYVYDLLPKTPPRTAPGPLTARIISGAFTGTCVAIAAASSTVVGVLLGVVGSLIGAFGGYKARVGLVRALGVPGFVVAIPEDLLAIGLAVLALKR